jgi:hypothetical protein
MISRQVVITIWLEIMRKGYTEILNISYGFETIKQ